MDGGCQCWGAMEPEGVTLKVGTTEHACTAVTGLSAHGLHASAGRSGAFHRASQDVVSSWAVRTE